MKLHIRPMTGEDKAALMRILRAISEFLPAEVVVAEEVLDAYLADGQASGYHVIVAEVGSSVVGYVCYGPVPLTEGTWDIYWLAVAPKRQGQGIGSALLSRAEDSARAANGRLALIETSSKPEYEKTREFHRSRGYEVVCRIADFYAPNDDRLVLQKRLCG